MLLMNYSFAGSICAGRFIGGLQVHAPYYTRPGTYLSFYYGNATVTDITNRSAVYNGYYPPYTIALAPKAGGIGSINIINGYGTIQDLNLAGGLNGVSNITGTGSLIANGSALGNIISALAGTGAFSANITGSLEAVASLVGSGSLVAALSLLVDVQASLSGNSNLTGTIAGALYAASSLAGTGDLVASITGSVGMIASLAGVASLNADTEGIWDMFSSLSGSSTVTADLRALGNLISNLQGTGNLTTVSSPSPGDMSAVINIGSSDPLSAENLAIALWNSLAASYNNPGTMGEVMNNLGAVQNPWEVALEGTYTAGDMMKILTAVAAGKTTIVDLGGGSATVTFRDINDTDDRVIADMILSERNNVTLTT